MKEEGKLAMRNGGATDSLLMQVMVLLFSASKIASRESEVAVVVEDSLHDRYAVDHHGLPRRRTRHTRAVAYACWGHVVRAIACGCSACC